MECGGRSPRRISRATVIILVLFIYLQILSTYLASILNMLKLIIIVAKKEIQIRFISSYDQLADVFTNPLFAASFTAFQFKLRVDPPTSA